MTVATDLVVEILEGPLAGASISLSGREMPYRSGAGGSVEYRRQQRIQEAYYPGNNEATHLLFGRKLLPTTFNGCWKDRYLGADRAVDLCDLFEDLVDSGALVRVSWETRVRVGHASEFGYKPGDPTGGMGDVAWDLTFMWVRDDTPRPTRKIGEARSSLREKLGSFVSTFSKFRSQVGTFIQSVGFFAGLVSNAFQPKRTQIENALVEAEQAETAIASSTARMLEDSTIPASVGEEALASTEKLVAVAALVAQVVDEISPARGTVSDEAASQLLASIERHDLIERAVALTEEAYDLRVRLEEILRPVAFVEIMAPRGGDLRDVAIEFFGDPDAWRAIAYANGIEDARIPDDVDTIFVPEELTAALDPTEAGQDA